MRAERGRRQVSSLMKVFGVNSDHARWLVHRVRLDQLGHIEVGLVADGYETREPNARLGGDQSELDAEVAALRDQPDRPRSELARCQVQLADRVGDAETVRPHEQGSSSTDFL